MVEHIYYNCLQHKNKKVRILTVDGRSHRGTIVNVDSNYVYLRPEAGSANTSAFYPYQNPYSQNILTLSLFTLLAIALI